MATTAEAEASPSAYEGGAGGKLRSSRRAHRVRPSTPYDRPPTAFRNPNSSGRNGWISKLVDPASRIITNSAARLFSSVFRKRLTAPPSTPETNIEAEHGPSEENPSVIEEQRRKEGENVSNNHDSNGIDELEQLLKQKTFTRVEFDRLTELLRSRTVDVPMEAEYRRTEPSTSQPVVTWKRQEKPTTTGLENGEGRLLLENISTHEAGLSVEKQILGEDASPTELAKAYMGSRPSKVSPSSLGTWGRGFKQGPTALSIVPHAPKSPIVPATSRSARHNPGIPGLTDPWSTTPRPRSRSALYNMSRVPYSGIGSAATIKGVKSNNDGYIVPSMSSDWTQGNNSSGVPQVLKRSSSALGDDFGSGGPVRRIRQKYNMFSPSKDEPPISSIQRPILSGGQKYDTSNRLAAENGHKHISNATFLSVPPQSTEMARKILQQLDKLVPSPKEKSSEQKLAMNREKLPAKLTLNMLSGRALRSMEDIESIKPQKDTPNAMLNGLNSSNFPDTSTISQKQDEVMDNGPTKSASVGVKLGHEVEAIKNAEPLVKSTKSGLKSADSFVSGFDANSRVKRAFQMCAPEDYVDLDDDSCSSKDASVPQPAEEKPIHSVVDQKIVVTEVATIDKPLISTTESKPIASGHVQNGVESITGASNGPIVNAKDAAPSVISSIPTTITNAVSVTLSSPCPLPAVHLPSNFSGSVLPKQETATHTFNFVPESAAKASSAFTSSSTTCIFSNSLGQKEDTECGSNLEKISSNAAVISVEGAGSDKGNKSHPKGNKHTSLQDPSSSGTLMSATSTIFSFGASTNSSLSNGSPSSTMSISAAPSSSIFCHASSSISSSCSASATISSVITPSLSAMPPSFPVGPLFKFGSGTMAAASPGTASQPSVTSGGLESSETEPKANRAHSFNIPVSSPTSAFPTVGNGIVSFNASTSADSTNPSSASSQPPSTALGTGNTGSVFVSTQATPAVSSIIPFTESASSQFGSSSSPNFGLGGSAFNFGSSSFGSSAPSTKPFALASGFGLGSSTSPSVSVGSLGSSSCSFTPSGMASSFLGSTCQSAAASISSSGFVSASSSPAPPGFSFGASASATSTGSAPGFSFVASAPATSSGSTSGFSFGASAPATSSGSTPAFSFGASVPAASSGSTTAFSFGASIPAASSGSKPGFSFGASGPATSSGSKPGFSFGASAPAMSSGSGTSLPFGSSFGASSGPMFSFTSAAPGAVTSVSSFTPTQPVLFGVQNPVASFGSASAGNDQMNEDSMAEDTVQTASAPITSPVFGQPVASATPPSNFSFGSPAVAPSSGVFQFGGHQNPTQQALSPFSATGTLPGAGGSFSLGAGGSDKANRRIVKVRRDKPRKK